MLNAVKLVAQIAAGVVVGNVTNVALDKAVNAIQKVVEAKKESH